MILLGLTLATVLVWVPKCDCSSAWLQCSTSLLHPLLLLVPSLQRTDRTEELLVQIPVILEAGAFRAEPAGSVRPVLGGNSDF